jgi:uncharacterized membrane protein
MSFLLDPTFNRYLIGGIFALAGLLHFIKPEMYIGIMPDYIPFHKAMVYISGVAELLGGIGIMIPAFRTFATWGLILLLIAVFPANMDMAWKGYKNHGFTVYTWILLGRLPLQFLLIYWVYWAGLK